LKNSVVGCCWAKFTELDVKLKHKKKNKGILLLFLTMNFFYNGKQISSDIYFGSESFDAGRLLVKYVVSAAKRFKPFFTASW